MQIFDLHADIGFDVFNKHRMGIKDVLNTCHVEKLRCGNIAFVNMACCFEGRESFQDMVAMIECLKAELLLSPTFQLVSKRSDFDNNNGRIKVVLSVEGMCGIKEDVTTKIEKLYRLGIRIGSLCWNDANALAGGHNASVEHGLSTLGEEAVMAMNRLNMGIDLAHANAKSFNDIIKIGNHVCVTHANAQTLCKHRRNLTDAQIKQIKDKDGCIGAVCYPAFIADAADDQNIKSFQKQIKYLISESSSNHVALGFDFMDFYPDYENINIVGLENASKAQNLFDSIDLSFDDMTNVAYLNALNFVKKLFP